MSGIEIFRSEAVVRKDETPGDSRIPIWTLGRTRAGSTAIAVLSPPGPVVLK